MDWDERMDFVRSSVSADKAEWLCTPFIEADIQRVVFQLEATKAPGSDNYSALFYLEFWNLVKEDVIHASLNFLNGGGTFERDNILIAHELISYMRTRPKGGVGYCCIKLDMSKAYDRVEYDFFRGDAEKNEISGLVDQQGNEMREISGL
ncbi:hypothetical protein QQ045_019372 [Rhodiola kirilowii]